MTDQKLRALWWLNGRAGVAYGLGFTAVQLWTNALLHFKTSVPAFVLLAAPHAAFAVSIAYSVWAIAVLAGQRPASPPSAPPYPRVRAAMLDPASVLLCGFGMSMSNLLAFAALIAITPASH